MRSKIPLHFPFLFPTFLHTFTTLTGRTVGWESCLITVGVCVVHSPQRFTGCSCIQPCGLPVCKVKIETVTAASFLSGLAQSSRKLFGSESKSYRAVVPTKLYIQYRQDFWASCIDAPHMSKSSFYKSKNQSDVSGFLKPYSSEWVKGPGVLYCHLWLKSYRSLRADTYRQHLFFCWDKGDRILPKLFVYCMYTIT